MPRIALPFPVLPGVSDEHAKDGPAKLFRSRPAEYAESRRRLGVTMERAYLQKTPMGSFVVAYIESERPSSEFMGEIGASNLDIDKEFLRLVKEIHGFDPSQPTGGPQPETIGEWTDPDVRKRGRGMAFTAPLIPGTTDKGRAFSREAFETRKDELTASRRALRENVEVVTLVPTPQGDVIAVYLEGEDAFETNRRFAASTAPYDVWFKDQLKTIFPPFIDFGQPVPGVEEFFDSQALLAKA